MKKTHLFTILLLLVTVNGSLFAQNNLNTEADINAKLFSAIDADDVQKLASLITKNTDLDKLRNPIGKKGRTLLQYAAKHGKLTVAKYLVGRGANLGIKSESGLTALDYAIKYKRTEVENFLTQAWAKSDLDGYEVFLKRKEQIKLAKTLTSESMLNSEQVNADLDFFQQQLEKQFAYLKTNRADYRSAIDAIRKKAKNGLSLNDLKLELSRIIGLFIDGHAGISKTKFPSEGYLPFLIEPAGNDFIAFKPDRSGFVTDNYPYILKIDDIDIQDWAKAGAVFRGNGSPQNKHRRGMRMLRYLQFMRAELGLPQTEMVEIELCAENRADTKTLSLSLATKKGGYGRSVNKASQILRGNIGYLRIESFSGSGSAVKDIEEWMPKFKNTKGLIIDVRGNTGGSRKGLLALASYLMSTEDSPSVANVCAYRLYEKFGEDHLGGSRFAYRENDPIWNDRERKAIHEFEKSFKPQWQPTEGEFSDWHYLLLSKREDNNKYHYNKPVIILTNADCFSATDIFLGALKGWRSNVKLMGEPSGGGSARSQSFKLPNTRIEVKCASMTSYQRTGRLYDTNGIHPDYLVVPEPEYFLKTGKDNVLETAITKIKRW